MAERGELPGFLHGIRGLSRSTSVVYCDYGAFDPQRPWAAVVLRNLPSDSSQESLRALTGQFQIPIRRIEKPRRLPGGCVCSLMVVDDIEAAEKLCVKMNKMEAGVKRMKAHIHPDSHTTRPSDSHHCIFNTDSTFGSKRAKKSQDPPEAKGESQATTGLGELSGPAEGFTLSLEGEDLCRVPGIPIREFAGESYSRTYGWAKHSGATIICKLPGSA